MTNLRMLAKGRECQVRLPCCDGRVETVVLAHLRLGGISGMGIKSPDLLACHCCFSCHQFCDTHHDAETQLAFANGIFRTQAQLIKEGKIKW